MTPNAVDGCWVTFSREVELTSHVTVNRNAETVEDVELETVSRL